MKDMLTGAHTWTQLSLDAAFKTIELREKKTPAGVAALADLLHKTEPQFYLYNFKDNIPVLIYFCPEKGPTIKNKMVYSTCKATLAETIMTMGYSDVKKVRSHSTPFLSLLPHLSFSSISATPPSSPRLLSTTPTSPRLPSSLLRRRRRRR